MRVVEFKPHGDSFISQIGSQTLFHHDVDLQLQTNQHLKHSIRILVTTRHSVNYTTFSIIMRWDPWKNRRSVDLKSNESAMTHNPLHCNVLLHSTIHCTGVLQVFGVWSQKLWFLLCVVGFLWELRCHAMWVELLNDSQWNVPQILVDLKIMVQVQWTTKQFEWFFINLNDSVSQALGKVYIYCVIIFNILILTK